MVAGAIAVVASRGIGLGRHVLPVASAAGVAPGLGQGSAARAMRALVVSISRLIEKVCFKN